MCDSFGDVNFDKLTSKQAKHAYEEWVERGISFSNHICTVSSIVYRYAIDMEYTKVNPFASVKRKTPIQRKVVWTEGDVRNFLDTAYSEFQWQPWPNRTYGIRMVSTIRRYASADLG